MEYPHSAGSASLPDADKTESTLAGSRFKQGTSISQLDMTLLDAARRNDLETCRQLIAAGANVNAADAGGDTPLILAAAEGSFELVKALVEAGAGVNAVECVKRSALHCAARDGTPEIIAYLCERGADVQARDMLDWTPLHFAAIYGRAEALELLLHLGANRDYCAHDGRTALMMATHMRHKVCMEILQQPVSLAVAAGNGHHHNVKMMLDNGIAIDSREQTRGRTALHRAASRGHLGMVRMLLERGASATAFDGDGRYPIHSAARKGRLDIVELLLQSGVDIESLGRQDLSPLDHAASKGHVRLVKMLLGLGAKVEHPKGRAPSLVLSARNGHRSMVELLLDAGTPLESTMGGGLTALHEAARNGEARIAKLLLGRGALVNDPSNMGETPLQLAVEGRHHDVVKALLEFKVDLEAPCQHKETALQLAVQAKDLQMVELLLAAGAKIDRADAPRGSALVKAVETQSGAALDAMLKSKPMADIANAVLSRALAAAFKVDKLYLIGHFARAGVFYDKDLFTRPSTALALKSIYGCNSLDGKFRLMDLAQGLSATGRRKPRSDRAPSLYALTIAKAFQTLLDRRATEEDLLATLTPRLLNANDDARDDLTYCLAVRVVLHGNPATLQSPQRDSAPGQPVCEFRAILEKHARWDLYKQACERLDDLASSQNRGKTPLTCAILFRDEALVRLLLMAGASVYLPDANGDSPLHAAVKTSTSMVRLLMRFGACSGAENRGGQTALALAERLALPEIAQLLREPQPS